MVAAIAGRGGGDAEAAAEVVGGAPGEVASRRAATSLLQRTRWRAHSELHRVVLWQHGLSGYQGRSGSRSTGSVEQLALVMPGTGGASKLPCHWGSTPRAKRPAALALHRAPEHACVQDRTFTVSSTMQAAAAVAVALLDASPTSPNSLSTSARARTRANAIR